MTAAGGILRHACEEQAHNSAVNRPQRPLQMQEVWVRFVTIFALTFDNFFWFMISIGMIWALCRYEVQESKMLSMSTRRHEYGRQTRDEAAEVSLSF